MLALCVALMPAALQELRVQQELYKTQVAGVRLLRACGDADVSWFTVVCTGSRNVRRKLCGADNGH